VVQKFEGVHCKDALLQIDDEAELPQPLKYHAQDAAGETQGQDLQSRGHLGSSRGQWTPGEAGESRTRTEEEASATFAREKRTRSLP
jgi:hypothetical protein